MQFLIQFRYRPNTKEAMDRLRPEHVKFREGLGKNIIVAGPMLDDEGQRPIGSLMILESPSLAEAKGTANQDPFLINQVFDLSSITPLKIMAINPPEKK